MITNNPMQLKAFIKKKASEKHISAQLVMQNYMLERLIERISLSKYKQNFIIKGGFLISAIVGLDTRTTMDLDTTIKGFTLTHESIREIFKEICKVEIEDDVSFEVIGVSDIRIHSPCCLTSAQSMFLPILLKQSWQKSLRLFCREELPTHVLEIITTYTRSTVCGATLAMRKYYG